MKIIVLALVVSSFALGQSFQGTLRGQISDPNGAATAGAAITLTDEGTATSRETITNDQGEYTFASLKPSIYTVKVESPGFKALERRGITVGTQAVVTLDLRLQLGEVTEQVNVTGDTPLLQTGDASTGQEISAQEITSLPLLGRNTFFSAKLAQNVVFVGNPKFARMQDQNGNSQVSISGGPVRTNNYLVDGISIADSTNRAVIVPSPEAVQELKLQATTYDAEVGRSGGGTFNTLLRSGSNELHGSAVGYIRETAWLANTFFANRAGQPIADQPYKNWAGSLGGPIVIPKVYDGRNKTFFFVATEAYRQTDGSTTTLSVPTPLERAGNFSQSYNKNGSLQTIYDPSSTILSGPSAGTRATPYVGNIIPASQLSPIGESIASYYPNPNASTPYYGAANYNVTGGYPNRGDQDVFKADENFTSWLRASGSFIYQKTFEVDYPVLFPNAANPGQSYCCDRKVDATEANTTITPDATTVITARWGFNRFYTKSTQASAGFNLTTLGFPQSLADITPNTAFPAITNNDFSNLGGGGTAQDVFYSRSINTGVSKFLGKHTLKAGFDYRTIYDAGTPASGPSSFGFSSVFTQQKAQASTVGTGSSLATMLLGFPTSGSMSVVGHFIDYLKYYGGYIQDDYRVTSKLTLNFGLRFEYESGIQEQNNQLIVSFDPTVANPLQQNVPNLKVNGEVKYAGVNGNPTQTGNALSVKPAPRFGFAYSLDPKTVIRGGYGLFWVPTFFNYQNAIGYSQTTSIITSTNGNFTPSATLANPYPSGLVQPTGNTLGGLSGIGQAVTVFDQRSESAGYVQQYSLEVQRQLPLGFIITAGTLGSHSLHLLENGQNIDQLNPSYFPLGSGLSKSVANPFYNNGGVGTVGSAKVSTAQLLLPYPQ